MSSYEKFTKNPKTGLWETAQWLDDYFGPHKYGVQFPDGTVVDPLEVELTVMENES